MSPRRLGQHFLTDAGWRARIVSTLGARTDDVWLEIGAGHGEITALLARSAGRVVAVELDPRLLDGLRSLAQEWPNIEVLAGDILQLDLASLFTSVAPVLIPQTHPGCKHRRPWAAAQKSPASEGAGHTPAGADRFQVYGNLPYYITSPILHRLFAHAERIASIHVVVQWEVAARLVARPGRRQYGYLSLLTQFYTHPEIVLRIPPGAFYPRPKVTSALVHMQPPGERATLGIPAEAKFLEFAKACFAQKRKTLLNNLRPLLGRERAAEALRVARLPPGARAEQLSLAQFAELYRVLSSSGGK